MFLGLTANEIQQRAQPPPRIRLCQQLLFDGIVDGQQLSQAVAQPARVVELRLHLGPGRAVMFDEFFEQIS